MLGEDLGGEKREIGQGLVEKDERKSGRMMENEERKKKTRPISCYTAYGLHEGAMEAV